jgi:RecA/RadA recombinase
MAPKKEKATVKTSGLTYEEAVKVVKAAKGSQSIIGSEIPEYCSVRKIRTGIPTLDYELGGGISEGRITIMGGKPSSAKTTTTLQGPVSALINEIKASGETKFGLIVDSEGGYDSPYARALGVDEKYLIIKRKKVIEDAFQEIDDLISMGLIKFLVIDSLDTMVSKKGDDNKYAATMGGTAGALAQHLPVLYEKIMEWNVTTIIIKQARVKIGGFNPTGNEIIQLSGGYALKHLADSIFIVNRLSNKNLSYTPIQLKAVKTRSSRLGLIMDMPLGSCGIDVVHDAIALAIGHGLITTGGGGWTQLDDDQGKILVREQGLDKFVAKIKDSATLTQSLIDSVYLNIIDTALVGRNTTEGGDLISDIENEKEKVEE